MRLSYAVLFCALAFPAAAQADIVVTSTPGDLWEEITVTGDGAANHLKTTRVVEAESVHLWIEETTGQALVDDAESCTQMGARVRCADSDPNPWSRMSVTVNGEGANDVLTDEAAITASGQELLVGLSGGDGADELSGTTFTRLSGGAGNDRMEGRFGGSVDGWGTGGAGDDVLIGTRAAGKAGYNYWLAEPGADLYVTKPNDFFDYSLSEGPVSLSLDAVANDGREGEGDNIGNQAWQITGSAFGDRVDLSTAQVWGVRLFSGAGDDAVTGSGMADLIDCGDGTDSARVGADDELKACEQIVLPPPPPSPADTRAPFVGIKSVRREKRGLRVNAFVDEPGTLSAAVHSRGRRVGRAAVDIAAGVQRFSVRLRRGAGLGRTLTVMLKATDAAGNATTRTRRIRLT